MNTMNPKVDGFLKKAPKWQEEMAELRRIALACGLTEELKWGKPCYSFEGGNVAIIQGFKESCAFMFFKGALLKDTKGLLERPGENSQAARRLLFTGVAEITKNEAKLKAWIKEAIAAEKAGLEVEFKKSPEPIPAELQGQFDKKPGLMSAFEALTPGRQRAYILHFSSAKQSATKTSRIEKCIPQILEGKGLNDR